MQTTTAVTRPARTGQPTASNRVGYVIAIGCNVAGLYITHHLLEWGWPRFLTDQFEDVLPIITVSLVYGIVTNVVFLVYDAQWWKSLVNVGGAIIGFVITLRSYQVYPFDFSGYAVNWSWLVTTVLIVGMVVAVIAAIVESVRTVTSLKRLND